MIQIQTPTLEEVHLSPSDRIKNMILKRWDLTENSYTDGDVWKFIRGVESLSRMVKSQLQPDAKKKLEDLVTKETNQVKKEIETIENDDLKLQTEQKKRLEFAKEKIDLLVDLIRESPIIVKDIDVDFDATVDMDELRKIVKTPLPTAEGSVKVS